ncbi:hypothetical protein [Streptomyces sp. NPDC017230]|uniref:hypothetical protein n=1 Tax=unclassified Streptomyces TaxID=2593676 RepID=UPI0037B859C5
MTVVTDLLPQQDYRIGRDRLEVLTALISAPSFDPLFRPDIVKVPPNHPVYRWNCLAADCKRATMGHGDLCSSHVKLWRMHRSWGGTRAEFFRNAPPVGPGEGVEQRPCRICIERPAGHLTLALCHYHEFRWYHHRDRHGEGTDFDDWLRDQRMLPGFGTCRARVCPELTDSPLGLCSRHESRYRRDGRPGGAALPSQWGTRYGRRGLIAPVTYADEHVFERWCASVVAVSRSSQVNLRGLHPLLRAEIKWGMFTYTQKAHGRWELITWQGLANFAREYGLRSLMDAGPEEERLLRKAVSREAVHIVRAVTGWLQPLYVTPAETREHGYILTEHFGRRLSNRSGRIDLAGVPQRWLRELIWDHLVAILRSPSCPRSGGTFDDMRRGGLELDIFLELHAPASGHDPRALTAEHMHQFVADQRQRERDGLASLAARGPHGKPSIVTANTRQRVFHRTRRLLRGALESGDAERLGLDRGFIAAMPAPGRSVQRARPPFADGVAQALADDTNLRRLAETYDPFDHGLRDAWETIIVTGRRCSEVLHLRLECLGRYGGLPMLWHDQTKVGNYDPCGSPSGSTNSSKSDSARP